MNATIFDSHKYAKRLMDAGVPAQAADIQAETMVEVMNQLAAGSGKLDTQDARLVRMDARLERMDAKIDIMDTKIDMAETRLEAKIADAKADLVRWMVGVSVLQMALISALVLKLAR